LLQALVEFADTFVGSRAPIHAPAEHNGTASIGNSYLFQRKGILAPV